MKQNVRNFKKRLIISLLAVLLLVSIVGVAFAVGNLLRSQGTAVKIVYTDGTYGTDHNPTDLFSDFYIQSNTTLSGTLILPGDTFADNIAEGSLENGDGVTLSKTGAAALDTETFYFDTPATPPENEPEPESFDPYASLWAFSFTGWKIAGTQENIPGQTAFQPGDVITPEVVETYATNGTLTLEALWGKCYFIRNPYENMVYTKTKVDGAKTLFELSTTQSTVPTGASDANVGNHPQHPKATIDGLYGDLRAALGSTRQERLDNPLAFDSFRTVVMLTGDLEYYTDTNQTTPKYYGYSEEARLAEGVNKNSEASYVGATYKSLGGVNFNYWYKPKSYSNPIFGNLRYDTVNFCLMPTDLFSQTIGQEFQLYTDGAKTKLTYIEFTARYNATLTGSTAIGTFRPADTTYVVLNGGTFNGLQNQYSTNDRSGKQLYWTVGRKASVSNINCGTTSAYENNYVEIYYNYDLKVLGGKISNIYGANNGANSIAAGERKITLLGDGSGRVEYDPNVERVYGGGSQSRLFGDIYLTAKSCTNLGSVYGGGRDYSATTYGNIYITLENCILSQKNNTTFGDLYGGGQYGNCEKTPENFIKYATENGEIVSNPTPIENLMNGAVKDIVTVGHGGDVFIKIKNTSVSGNIFGSGMGQTQILDVRVQYGNQSGWKDSPNLYPSDDGDWFTPIGGYPSYNPQDGRVFVYGYREGSWTSIAPDTLSYYTGRSYAYLSLATVENVDISIVGSTVGTETNGKGNIYGGGSIAKVLGDVKISIASSTIYGNVYGGGDGVTVPSQVAVYQPDRTDDPTHKEYYVAPTYTVTQNENGQYEVSWTKQQPQKEDKSYEMYTWSGDKSLLDAPHYGVDQERKLIYSPNTDGLGTVMGDTTVTIADSTVEKNVYGGGNLGTVQGNTSVTINGTSVVDADIFGGGNGDVTKDQTAVLGAVYGNSTLTITGGTLGTVYGGCNAADVNGHVTVTIQGGSVDYAYGGNNQKGDIQGNISVTLSDTGHVTDKLYGGGNLANYDGVPKLQITGGSVGVLDSEQNEGGTVTGTAYGGGNLATVAGTDVSVSGGQIRSLFGGSFRADITGSAEIGTDPVIKVTITKGEITTFVGGNDQGGNISGNIKITVGTENAAATVNKDIKITNFFGGGNSANYTYGNGWTPTVTREDYDDDEDPTFQGITITIYSGDIYQAFGGGVMASAENIRMYIHGGEFNFLYGGGYRGTVQYTVIHLHGGTLSGAMMPEGQNGDPPFEEQQGGYVFGGGYAGNVYSASVHLEDDNEKQPLVVGHSLFGGSNKANVTETNVVVKSGKVIGSVYGGGFEGDAENTNVVLSGGDIGEGAVFGEGDERRHYIGNVYGGGYMGDTDKTHIDIAELHHNYQETLNLHGNVYGGGHNADVIENTYVHFLYGTIAGNIYGGGRNGDVLGTAHVDFFSGTLKGNLYAGGFKGTVFQTKALITDDFTYIKELGSSAVIDQILLESVEKILSDPNILINQLSIQIEGTVFGGGEGETATVKQDTSVLINLIYDFDAVEPEISVDLLMQEQVSATITPKSENYSYIGGNVYGGGDLGQIGVGVIHGGSNTATITTPGTSQVTVKNGYIKGSVFGGGSGVPPTDVTYESTMGAVFGNTLTNIYGGYIQGNIYGGGTQSRVYYGGSAPLASKVTIAESAAKIAIGGSIFGGGDRGNGTTQNASIPTTVGNVAVEIIGSSDGSSGSKIYFVGKGGVYGDGNLCLVSGQRSITLTNFNTGKEKILKIFYSLQRADLVILDNSKIVLLGAVDLVEEGDTAVYSINRISRLIMKNGSTFKLEKIVKLFGELVSDVETDRQFIYQGNNNSNNYTETAPTAPLTDPEIDAYHGQTFQGTVTQFDPNGLATGYLSGQTITNGKKNVVCVANGLYLELTRYSAQNGSPYGSVFGLFTLELLHAKPGEGGGFVYADIATSTGDFICETARGNTFTAVNDPLTEETFASSGPYYKREPGQGYVEATQFEEGVLYYTAVLSEEMMRVVDNVGGYKDGGYTFYFWYINGPIITYTGNVTGYIGSETTKFQTDKVIPHHEDVELQYVLFSILGNTQLTEALNANKYTLVQKNNTLSGQEIALELVCGDVSLGFLEYTNGKWMIKTTTGSISGYQGNLIDEAGDNNVLKNLLTKMTVVQGEDKISIVLHKSTEVVNELRGMHFTLEIDLLKDDNTVYTEGTSTLIFDIGIAIVRLVPTQTNYTDNGKSFAGVDQSETITITGHSAFTSEYQTKYIPIAFPRTHLLQMKWELSTVGYAYYMDDYGHYLTEEITDATTKRVIAGSFPFDPTAAQALDTIYLDGEVYKCRFTVMDSNGFPQEFTSEFKLFYTSQLSYLPAGTKITMIDASSDVENGYYYYILENDTYTIDLMDFYRMGSLQRIEDLVDPSVMPAFVAGYLNQESANFAERLIFIVDFSNVDWGEQEKFSGNLVLRHVYNGVDIMDYVTEPNDNSSSYLRSVPHNTPYTVGTQQNGLKDWDAAFQEPQYYDKGSAELVVSFNADKDWINTQLQEGEYSLYMELQDANGNKVAIPVGMSFFYEGKEYYPGLGGDYVIIPLAKAGEHLIKIQNDLYSLRDYLGSNQATFHLYLYSAPDSEYYNALTGIITMGQNKDIPSYTIQQDPVYSLSVISQEDPMYELGEHVTVLLNADVVGLPTWSVSATVERVTQSGTTEVEWDQVFATDKTAIEADGTYAWKTEAQAEAGTYRLRFTCGDCVEYWYFILLDPAIA